MSNQTISQSDERLLAVHPSLAVSDLGRYRASSRYFSRLWNYGKRRINTFTPIAHYHRHCYKQAMVHHVGDLPPLQFVEDYECLKQLRQIGVYQTSLDELNWDFSAATWAKMYSVCMDLAKMPVGPLEFCLSANSRQVLQMPEMFTWGLQTQLLDLVENYLQLPVAYHGVYLRRDVANHVERKTRCWHLDMEDHRIFKVIVYLKDVDESSGPFEYLTAEDSAELCQHVKYRYGYLNSKAVESIIPESRWNQVIGKAGTVLFVDTARLLHRGRLPADCDRYSLFFDYTSRRPRQSYYCKSSLSPWALQEMASQIPSEKHPYMLWRHHAD